MGREVKAQFKYMNIPKWMKFILIIVIFQACFFILQISLGYLMDWIFWYNHRIGINQWNYWIFDYPTSNAYLNSFWGSISTDLFTLILSIYITLSLLNENLRLWGWKILLIFRIFTQVIFLIFDLYFLNTNVIATIGNGIFIIFVNLIPFGVYKIKERL